MNQAPAFSMPRTHQDTGFLIKADGTCTLAVKAIGRENSHVASYQNASESLSHLSSTQRHDATAHTFSWHSLQSCVSLQGSENLYGVAASVILWTSWAVSQDAILIRVFAKTTSASWAEEFIWVPWPAKFLDGKTVLLPSQHVKFYGRLEVTP